MKSKFATESAAKYEDEEMTAKIERIIHGAFNRKFPHYRNHFLKDDLLQEARTAILKDMDHLSEVSVRKGKPIELLIYITAWEAMQWQIIRWYHLQSKRGIHIDSIEDVAAIGHYAENGDCEEFVFSANRHFVEYWNEKVDYKIMVYDVEKIIRKNQIKFVGSSPKSAQTIEKEVREFMFMIKLLLAGFSQRDICRLFKKHRDTIWHKVRWLKEQLIKEEYFEGNDVLTSILTGGER